MPPTCLPKLEQLSLSRLYDLIEFMECLLIRQRVRSLTPLLHLGAWQIVIMLLMTLALPDAAHLPHVYLLMIWIGSLCMLVILYSMGRLVHVLQSK